MSRMSNEIRVLNRTPRGPRTRPRARPLCAEEELDGLRAENSTLLRRVHQLQARCLELYARVREGACNGDGSPPPTLPHNRGTPDDDARHTSKPVSAVRAP